MSFRQKFLFSEIFNLPNQKEKKMRFPKTVFIALTILVGAVLCAAPAKKIRIAPGALCYAWNKNTLNKPDTVPAGGFVDESTHFTGRNIYKCQELINIKSAAFIMWEGYLRVPKNGNYRFTLSIYANNWDSNKLATKIFLNNKQLIHRAADSDKTVTAQASLKKGFVKIRLYVNPTDSVGPAGFTLKFAPATGMKMTPITPASLYHPVSEEE